MGLDPEHERLAPLLGRWRTEGWTLDDEGAHAERIEAFDTYERLPGGALLHLVDARVGHQKVEGAEVIGYDPDQGAYVTRYFGTDGPNAYQATLVEEAGALVWSMRSARDRFTGTFTDPGTIDGHWEALDEDGRWRAWMNITLTRQDPPDRSAPSP